MQNIEKIAFKVVLMKFLAMHITNQKKYLDVFMVGNVQNIFMEHLFPCIYIQLPLNYRKIRRRHEEVTGYLQPFR